MLISLVLLAAMPVFSMQTVPYAAEDGYTLNMDIYAAKSNEPMPVVIVIHGGAWIAGDRSDMAELCVAIARTKMIALSVEYRLAPQNKWPIMLDDVQSALRFVKTDIKRLGGDPSRIAVAGASAGGHLALLLSTMDETSSDIDAVLNLFGPTDLSKDFNPLLMSMMATQLLGKSLGESQEEIRDMSPIHYLSEDDAPVFTIHGTDDPLVPFKQAERLEDAHPHHTLLSVEGMVHGLDTSRKEELRAIMKGIEFLLEKLAS